MAIYTGTLCRVKFMAGVAALTGRYGMHTLKWELREFMIELIGFIPTTTLMAYTAITQFFRFMYVVRTMAITALGAQAVIQ